MGKTHYLFAFIRAQHILYLSGSWTLSESHLTPEKCELDYISRMFVLEKYIYISGAPKTAGIFPLSFTTHICHITCIKVVVILEKHFLVDLILTDMFNHEKR